MKKRDTLFLFSFIASSLIHVQIYSLVGDFYFGGHERIRQEVHKNNPSFTYYPMMRDVKITPVPTSHEIIHQKHTPHNTQLNPSHSQKSKNQKLSVSTKERNNSKQPVSHAFHKTESVARVLLPTVENIDLRNRVIYDAFYNYYELLSTIIGRFAVYPSQARVAGTEGVAYVSFMLRKTGQLGEVVLKKSSHNSLLDRAAISAIQNASPFPPLPVELNRSEIRLNVPISFEIE